MSRPVRVAAVCLLGAASAPAQVRDIGPLVPLQDHLATHLTGPQPAPLVIPWWSDSHLWWYGQGTGESKFRDTLRRINLLSQANPGQVRGFVGLGDFGSSSQSTGSLKRFVEILGEELGSPSLPTFIGILGNHEWYDGDGKAPWLQVLYPTANFGFVGLANDRPIYFSTIIGSPDPRQGNSVAVVATEGAGTKGGRWIVAEELLPEQLHWLHQTCLRYRNEGRAVVLADHYPYVSSATGQLVSLLKRGTGIKALKTVLQFDNVVRMIAGHIGSEQYRVGGNQFRPALDVTVGELENRALRVDGGSIELVDIDPSGALLPVPDAVIDFGTSWAYPAGVVTYGHSTISQRIRSDIAILIDVNEEPRAGRSTFRIACDDAPANAQGWLAYSPQANPQGKSYGTFVSFVEVDARTITVPLSTDGFGRADYPVSLDRAAPGQHAQFQFFFLHPLTGEVVASNALQVVVQP